MGILETMEKEERDRLKIMEIRKRDYRENKKYYVYVHTSPEGKKYVGLTKNISNRWSGKLQSYKYNKELAEDIEKFGWENFLHDILVETYYGWLARNIERDLILRYKGYCYNKTNFSKDFHNTKFFPINPKISQK